MAGHAARIGKQEIYEIIGEKGWRSRSYGIPKLRIDDNIKMGLREWSVGMWTGSG